MKFDFLLFSIIVLLSCNRTSKQIVQQEDINGNWIPISGLIQHHTYTKSGLLDTSYQIKNSYNNGAISTTSNFFITRTYDVKNNLTNEKKYGVPDNYENSLLEEKSIEYDNRNNPIVEIDRDKYGIIETIKDSYNEKKQKIQEISIREKIATYTKNNLTPSYDTSITLFEYDTKGNIVKLFYKNHNRENTKVTTFCGTQEVSALDINSKGDTITITKYKKLGNTITKIRENKDGSSNTEKEVYENGKEIKKIFIDNKSNYKFMEIYRYDTLGNEIEKTMYNNNQIDKTSPIK